MSQSTPISSPGVAPGVPPTPGVPPAPGTVRSTGAAAPLSGPPTGGSARPRRGLLGRAAHSIWDSLWGSFAHMCRRFCARYKWEVIMGTALGVFTAILAVRYLWDFLATILNGLAIAVLGVVALWLLLRGRTPPQ